MYRGPVTNELLEAYHEYKKQHDGCPPDEYDEVCYENMTHDEFLGYIKEALKKKCDILDVIE